MKMNHFEMNYDDLSAKNSDFRVRYVSHCRGYQNQPFKVLAQSLLLALSENIWETTKIYCFIIHFRIKTAMNWHIYYPFSDTQIRDSWLNMLKYG